MFKLILIVAIILAGFAAALFADPVVGENLGYFDTTFNNIHAGSVSVAKIIISGLSEIGHLYPLGFLFGCLILSFDLKKKPENESKRKALQLLFAISLVPLLAMIAAVMLSSKIHYQIPLDTFDSVILSYEFTWYFFGYALHTFESNGFRVHLENIHFLMYFECIAASILIIVWWLRYGVQYAELSSKKLTIKSKTEQKTKSDIRYISEHLPPDKKRFDPVKYVDFKKGIFVGLSHESKPIYIKMGDWVLSHISSIGRTRSGKGVFAQIIGWQSIGLGEFLVMLDPKKDSYLAYIYKKACDFYGKKYVYLDINYSAHPQMNLFEGCDRKTIEDMLISGFGFTYKGDKTEAYKTFDRKAAKQAADYIINNPGVTPKEVFDALSGGWNDKADKLAPRVFAETFAGLANLPAVNRKAGTGGVDIGAMVKEGGCLYVNGDMLDSTVCAVQRMILLRLMAEARMRPQNDEDNKMIRVIADEFKVHISRPFMSALAMSAGWKMLCIMMYQTFGDLNDCPDGLDAEYVKSVVTINSAIDLVYRCKDIDTADYIAKNSGKTPVDNESFTIEKNIMLAEVKGERMITRGEDSYIDTNMIQRLPTPDQVKKTIGCGILTTTGLPEFCFTSPVFVDRTDASAVTPTVLPPADGEEVTTTKDRLQNIVSPLPADSDVPEAQRIENNSPKPVLDGLLNPLPDDTP